MGLLRLNLTTPLIFNPFAYPVISFAIIFYNPSHFIFNLCYRNLFYAKLAQTLC